MLGMLASVERASLLRRSINRSIKCFQLVSQVCRLYEGEDRDDPVTVQ